MSASADHRLARVPAARIPSGFVRLVREAQAAGVLRRATASSKTNSGSITSKWRAWPDWHQHVSLASTAPAFLAAETCGSEKRGRTDAARRALLALLIGLSPSHLTCQRRWHDSSPFFRVVSERLRPHRSVSAKTSSTTRFVRVRGATSFAFRDTATKPVGPAASHVSV